MDRAETEIIRREEAINEIHKIYNEIGRLQCLFNNALSKINEKTGKWIIKRNPQDVYAHSYCSECGAYWSSPTLVSSFNYCPSCGAKMDKEWGE